MSWQSLADVFEYVQRTADLSTNEVVVLLALAHYANAQGANAFPSQRTLRTLTKLAERTLRYTLRKLEARGCLTAHVQRGRRGATHYSLKLPHVQLKGAPHAPYPTKGAPHAPFEAKKGAPHAAEKGHHMPPDPGSEIQDTSPFPSSSFSPPASDEKPGGMSPGEKFLRAGGWTEESDLFQWALEAVLSPNGQRSNGPSNRGKGL